eukprot:gene18984-43160_t
MLPQGWAVVGAGFCTDGANEGFDACVYYGWPWGLATCADACTLSARCAA